MADYRRGRRWLAGLLVKGYGYRQHLVALLAPSLPAGCCPQRRIFSRGRILAEIVNQLSGR